MSNKFQKKIYNLLRRSEKYTKTDMVYLAKGGFWLILGQIISSFSVFLLAIAFANLIPKETYGQYKYILSIFGILTIATLPGINSAVTRAIAQGNEHSFYPALKTKIKWGFLGFFVSLIIAIYYYMSHNYALATSFFIVSIMLPFNDSFILYQAYFNGKKLFKSLTKYNSTLQILSVLILIIAIYLSDNLYIILLSFFIPIVVIRLIYILIIKNKYKLNKNIDPNTIAYGKNLSFTSLLDTIAAQIDKILIFHYIGATELAVYYFALAPLEQMKSLVKPLQTLAIPKFALTTKNIIKNTLIKKVLKLSMLLVLISVIYILSAPYLYKIIFPQYLDSIKYSQIFAISFTTLPLLTILSAFEAQKMLKEIYIFKISSGISQIIISFFLIINFGLLGAIVARVVSRFINIVLSLFLLKNSKD